MNYPSKILWLKFESAQHEAIISISLVFCKYSHSAKLSFMYSNIKLKCFTIKLIHNNLSMDILHKNILLCHDKLFLEFNTENVML